MTITRRLWELSAPIIGLNLLNVLALVVDTAMCGRLPNAEDVLTGLGFGIQIIFLLMVAMMGLTVGTVSLVSRGHGAEDYSRVEHVLRQSVLMTILLGLGVAIGGNLVAPFLLTALGASDAVAVLALEYLRPLLLGTAFNYLVLLFAAVLRGVGNTRLPFFVALVSNVLNVAINYALILGNFGFPSLGIFGAAIGTVISQAAGAGLLWWSLRRGVIENVRLRLARKLDGPLISMLIRVGMPAALDMVILNAAFLSIIGMLGRLDEVAVAAHGIGLRIQALAFVPGLSISQATAALVGQALGANDVDGARAVLRSSAALCTSVMTALGALIIAFSSGIVASFDVSPGTALHAYSLEWIRLLGYGFPIVGGYVAFVGLLQGAGFTNLSLRINFLATVLFQIPLSYILGFPLGMGTFGVWLAFPLSFVVKAGLGFLAYRKGEWAKTGKDV